MDSLPKEICLSFASQQLLLACDLTDLWKALFEELGCPLRVTFRKMYAEEIKEARPMYEGNEVIGVQDVVFIFIDEEGKWLRRKDLEEKVFF